MRTPLFLAAVIFMISLTISQFLDASLSLCLLFFAAETVLFVLVWRLRLHWYLVIFGLIFVLGFAYGEYRESIIPENPFTDEENVTVSGFVINDPVKTEYGLKCNVSVSVIDEENLSQSVNIIVLTSGDSVLTYGDELTVTGDFLTSKVANPGEFDYAAYLEQRNFYGVLSALYGGSVTVESGGHGHFILETSYWLKHRFEAALAYLPEDQKTIINGIFFGDTSAIDQSTSDILTKSGIRHCFAVSGLHVGYMVLFLAMIANLLKFGRGQKLLMIIPCLFLYAAMTGFSASVLRASVMCLMIYGADLLGREKNGFNGLAAAALLILIWEPLALFQVGFQLSFVAMFAILFVTPWLNHLVKKDFPGKSALLITVAAQIGVMPILAYYFHVVSFVSLLISTVCCLLVGSMVILCFAALIFAIFWPPLGALFLIPCGALGTLIIHGVTAASALPFAYLFKGDFSIWILILLYAVIAVIILLPWFKYRKGFSVFLLCVSFALFLLPLGQNREELQITFLSVGEGDAIYIHTPAGEDLMIDACDKGNQTEVSYIIRPFLLYQGVNHIDRMILSHNDIDHSGGVSYLNEFFGILSYVLAQAASYTYDDISTQAVADGTAIIWVSTGDVIDLGNDTTLEILYPDEEEDAYGNDLSMVARLSYGDFSILFTGDLEEDGISALLTSGQNLNADILKIPHHGSEYSYDEEFYQAVSPENVIISVGENSYGHPYEGIMDYCNDEMIGCFRTDLAGAVTVISDGSGYDITIYEGDQK